ncbi:MAG: hypothetical protein AAF673_02290 [Pseudomonadota bacterium]
MILLIRHCRPKIDYNSKYNHEQANDIITQYNSTSDIAIEEIDKIKTHLGGFLKEKKSIVLSSSMPRALITAKSMFGKNYDILVDKNFIEFDLKFIKIPLIKLKFGTWATISRLLWFAGIGKTDRKFKTEKLRAEDCAEILYRKSLENDSVALVAHGMINYFIEKRLRYRGYKRISKVTNGFCSITILHC